MQYMILSVTLKTSTRSIIDANVVVDDDGYDDVVDIDVDARYSVAVVDIDDGVIFDDIQ